MKKLISLFVCLLFTLSIFSNTYAADDQKTDSQGIITSTIRDITYDEAVKLLMEKKGYSLEKAKSILADKESDSEMGLLYDGYTYSELMTIQDFGQGAAVEYGILAKIYYSTSFRQFSAIEDKWELPAASGTYTYTNGFHSPTINTPPSSLWDRARGQIEIAVTYSNSAEATLGVGEFITAGYTVGSTQGLTYYFRKTLSFSTTYNLY